MGNNGTAPATVSEAGNVKKLTRLLLLSDGTLTDFKRLQRAPLPAAQTKAGTSSEIREPQLAANTARRIVQPPYNLDDLASLLEANVTHFRAVVAKVDDAVGRGFTIVSATDEMPEERRQGLMAAIAALNKRMTPTQLFRCAGLDFEGLGNGYIELVRDKSRKLIEWNHLPGRTMRVTIDGLYAQVVKNKAVYFKPFKDERKINRRTGKEDPAVSFDDEANEVLALHLYHPRSEFYGVPDSVPALGAIAGDLYARDYNLDFFENGAVPAYAVIVEGADVDEPVEKAIKEFFRNDLKGSGNQHRTFVLPVPVEGVKVHFEKLNVDIKDGSFKLYRQDNRADILAANGVPPARAGFYTVGTLGGDVSKEADKIYRETTVAQRREFFEEKLNEVLRDGLDAGDLRLQFNRITFDDRSALGSLITAISSKGVVTKNEIRELLSPLFEGGLDKLDDGDELSEPAPALNPFGGGGQPGNGQTPPNPEVPGGAGAKSSPRRCKRMDYDDIDIENLPRLEAEYTGCKDGEVVAILKSREDIVAGLKADMVKLYDKMLRAAIDELERQGGKRFKVFKVAAQPVRVSKVLAEVERFEADVRDALADSYAKAMIRGAKFSANAIGARFVKVRGLKARNVNVSTVEEATGIKAVVQLPDVAIDVSFRLESGDVQRFIERETSAMSRNITKSMSNRIRRQLEKGIREQETADEMRDRLLETVGVPGLRDTAGRLITAETRAEMIARTEVGKAYNVGTIKGYESSGTVAGVQVADGDDFDEPCRKANGTVISLRAAEANPLEHPNCTKAFIPVLREEAA